MKQNEESRSAHAQQAARGGVRFADIQAILNRLVEGLKMDSLRDVHGDSAFGWDTLAQLKNVVVRPEGPSGKAYPLIDMALVQQKRGQDTNLVKALNDGTGVDFYGRMPLLPPAKRYATPEEIQQIIDWLNSGMPE